MPQSIQQPIGKQFSVGLELSKPVNGSEEIWDAGEKRNVISLTILLLIMITSVMHKTRKEARSKVSI